jgi:hypothetical protein
MLASLILFLPPSPPSLLDFLAKSADFRFDQMSSDKG